MDKSSDSSMPSLSSKTQPTPNQNLNQPAQPTQSLQAEINELSEPTQLTHTAQQQQTGHGTTVAQDAS
eukprot:9889358-Ditylum_brightwellii.AAC.1